MKIHFAIALLLASSMPAAAQTAGSAYEVERLRFEGNKILKDDQLLDVIRTRETPWGLWKWIYRVFHKEIFGGQKPQYYDPVTFASDFYQLKRFYEDNGFFKAKIDTSIILRPEEHGADLTFLIKEGQRSMIDTIIDKGFEGLPPNVLEELHSNRLVAAGEPYVSSKLEAELRRIVNTFANSGYINVKVGPIGAERYASTNNVTVIFSVTPGKRYTFGTITVQQDTATQQRIDTSIVLRHLDFAEGEFYSEQKKIESERNLNRLGIFAATKIENAIPRSSLEGTQIPVKVLIRTRALQELTPEIGVNDENNAFNVLLGIGYNHRNFFGGARNFSTRLRLNLQSLQDIRVRTFFNGTALRDSLLVTKAELTVQLTQPYFLNNKTSITGALSGILDKERTYYVPSLNSRIGTISQTATFTKFFVDWNLQLSDPKTVATQQDTVLKEEGFEKQFNSIISLTLQRDKRNDLFNPSEGFFHSISLEEGGSLPRIFGKMLGLDLPYSQYVRLTLVGQWYWDPSKKQDLIWATRWRFGAAFLYGHSPLPVPLTQRYFAGGSGSVRGWTARALGAMPPGQRDQGGDALFEGNTEARWNLLKGAGSILFLDLEKISTVFFVDCGNVWTEPNKLQLPEVAVAAGFGLRYNTIAGPIRIDFGMKVYDPDAPPSRRWITQKRFFPETFSQGVIHLGVGQTF
jgi:outer membrane protein assembly complex protein YaeT